MPRIEPGTRFGRLVVASYCQPQPDPKHPKYLCVCDCGTEKAFNGGNLERGASASCGCLRIEQLRARSTTHGMSYTPEFRIWCDLRERCSNPSRDDFERYGARGITVCARWLESFENFFADMGHRPSAKHSIDRIDTNGNYEPDNCRWATATIQRENQRRTKLFTFNGHTGTLKDLARRAGISYTAVHQRVNTLKWTVEKALTTPLCR